MDNYLSVDVRTPESNIFQNQRSSSVRLFSDNSNPTSPLLTPEAFIRAEKISLLPNPKRTSKIHLSSPLTPKDSSNTLQLPPIVSPKFKDLRRSSIRRGDSDGMLNLRLPEVVIRHPSRDRSSIFRPAPLIGPSFIKPPNEANFLSKSDGATQLSGFSNSLRQSRKSFVTNNTLTANNKSSVLNTNIHQSFAYNQPRQSRFFNNEFEKQSAPGKIRESIDVTLKIGQTLATNRSSRWMHHHNHDSMEDIYADRRHGVSIAHVPGPVSNIRRRTLSRRHSSNQSLLDPQLAELPRDLSYLRYLDQSGETRSSIKDSSVSKSGSVVSSSFNNSSNSEDVFLFPKVISRESFGYGFESSKGTPLSTTTFRTASSHFHQQVRVGYLSQQFIREMKKKRSKRKRVKSEYYEQVRPIERFRKIARCVRLLLRCLTDYRLIEIISQASQMPFPMFSHSITAPTGDKDGLVFNRDDFKPNNERIVDDELRRILTLPQFARTNKDVDFAVKRLKIITEEFGEFPRRMQEALVRVSWMDEFEAKRVIIRQGQPADNFYYIIKGTALVTKNRLNANGEVYSETLEFLKRGMSFGELAIVRQGDRTANVVSNSQISLLTVDRSDFVDIFMHRMDGTDPEFITFLRKLPEFAYFPMDNIPRNKPKICAFTYFRLGIVICTESVQNDMIVVVKSGFCKVIKKLKATKPNLKLMNNKIQEIQKTRESYSLNGRRSSLKSSKENFSDLTGPKLPDFQSRLKNKSKKQKTQSNEDHLREVLQSHLKWKSSHPMTSETLKLMTEEEDGLSLSFEEARSTALKQYLEVPPDKLNGYYSPDPSQNVDTAGADKNLPNNEIISNHFPEMRVKDEKDESIFIHVQTLGEGDVFGLLPLIFDTSEGATPMSLVSEGAECILLNKEFYLKHLDDELRERLMRTLEPYPTEEALQHGLQQQCNWDAYKSIILKNYYNKSI